ncbi:DmsC/YnfH family molybdoenzyme membrane anchor subunit [Senegalimassilia anaerobia]|uniref:DmsC/YnfH family molybdoenzyme membrane anchor subunit n=1 Tax=Senegalimassilia anaerobia TaxID=1473216 RepID=UPI0023F0BCC4|nr:DmsC/YnfH family molybdoenzyme membrane anchor subunit [Senegalimassilia anaerobia]
MFSEFPLFLFTILGGLAAGAYVFAAFFPPMVKKEQPWLLPLISLILLAIGGIALLFHLGRFERMFLAFANPTAGIAQEGYVTVLFGLAIVADLVASVWKKSSIKPIKIICAICGLAFAIVTGLAYMSYVTVPAWATWQTAMLFVVGDLAMGAGLIKALDKAEEPDKKSEKAALVLYALFACAALLESVHFITIGTDFILQIIAMVLAIAAAIIPFAWKKEGKEKQWVIFACIALAVLVSRYSFYIAAAI